MIILEQEKSFAPGKAANAGGVSTSGLEMSQNSQHLRWSEVEVDAKLKEIMKEFIIIVIEHQSVSANRGIWSSAPILPDLSVFMKP